MDKLLRNLCSVLLFVFFVGSASAQAQIGISINIGTPPPPLPFYDQPELPGPGYIWTPGYWAWDPDINDFYWIPGTWVFAPQPGYLWTPAWWGWNNGYYAFHRGYWGPHVGFYGGISYGYGYNGHGYEGGRWQGGRFFYNRTVNNVGHVHIANVYSRAVTTNGNNRVSFNGGTGGIAARPNDTELRAARETHLSPTALQARHAQAASANTSLRYSSNHGRPTVAATAKPAAFDRPTAKTNPGTGGELPTAAETHRSGSSAVALPKVKNNFAVKASPIPARSQDRAEKPKSAPVVNHTSAAPKFHSIQSNAPAARTHPAPAHASSANHTAAQSHSSGDKKH